MTQMNDYLQRIREALNRAVVPVLDADGKPVVGKEGNRLLKLDPAFDALRRMVEDECRSCNGKRRVGELPCLKCLALPDGSIIDVFALGPGTVLRDISQLRPGEWKGGVEQAVLYLLPSTEETEERAHILTWELALELDRGITDEEAARIVAEALEKNLTDEVKE